LTPPALALNNAIWPSHDSEDDVRFWAILIPRTSSERDGDDAENQTPILHTRPWTAGKGAGSAASARRPGEPKAADPARRKLPEYLLLLRDHPPHWLSRYSRGQIM
jgi:hypothetical protein